MVPQPPLSYEEGEGKKAALILMKHSQFDKTLRYIEKKCDIDTWFESCMHGKLEAHLIIIRGNTSGCFI